MARRATIPPGPPLGECPDANLLAGFACGTLLQQESAEVARHLESCTHCRDVVANLPREVLAALVAPPARRRWTWPRWTAAAASILVVGLGLWLLTPVGSRPTTNDLLARAAQELGQLQPELAGFAPLSAEELQAPSEALRRGGLALLYPASLERVLETRPTFRWEEGPGVTGREVRLSRRDGQVLWKAASPGASLAYPSEQAELEPGGAYLWEVLLTGVLGTARETQAFEVAGAERLASWKQALQAIDRVAPESLRPLVAAHLALRRGHVGEAERQARAFLGGVPGEPLGLATLLQALRRQGAAEAGKVEAELRRRLQDEGI